MSAIVPSPRFLPSPSSPTGSDSKHRPDSVTSFTAPYSPVSPTLMSVATKSYVSAYGKNQHTDEMAQRPPRSPADNYMSSNQKMNSYQEGTLKRANTDDDGSHRDKRQKLDLAQGDKMDVDNTAAPTNHDRQRDRGEASHMTASSRQDQIMKDDFAEPFLLCKSSVPRAHPDPQQHLLAAYGLLPLLKTVARNDPQTGEKINKLRKSYEGQMQSFALSGRNKPVKSERNQDEGEPGPLRMLVTISEGEWEEGAGRSKIDVTADFRAKLEKAVQLQPGPVRNNDTWEDLLGHEKAKSRAAPIPQPHPASRIPNGTMRPAAPVANRSTRGKKRSYSDDSFVGYGEGYSEGDDGDEDDYAKRKRKKDSFGPSSSFYNGR